MGAAGFDHALVFLLEPAERVDQRLDGRQHAILDRADGRDVHGRRERVVGRLGHIDIVVRMQELFAHDLIAAIGDDLVAVHVRLRAGAGLPHDQREIVRQPAGNDLVRGLLDGSQLLLGHLFRTQRAVGAGSCLFEDAEGVDDLRRHGLKTDADGEIVVAALGLRAPVFIGGYLHLAHGIVFDPVLHRSLSYLFIHKLTAENRRDTAVSRGFRLAGASAQIST